MYNRKLQIRESDARLQIFTFDNSEGSIPTMKVAKTENFKDLTPRKGHCSAIFCILYSI